MKQRSLLLALTLLAAAPGIARAQAGAVDAQLTIVSPVGMTTRAVAPPPFVGPVRRSPSVVRAEDLVRELSLVRRDILRTERVGTREWMVYAGIPMLAAGAAGFVAAGIGLADTQGWSSSFRTLIFAPCFVGSAILTIAGLILTATGFDSLSSYDRRRAEAAARRGPLLEHRRQLEIQLDLMTVQGGAVATVGGSF